MQVSDKKILMIAATPFFSDRGCHIRIYNEMKYLKKSGYDVTLVTYHLGKDIEGLKVKRIINIPWYKKITPGPSWHKIYLDLFLLFSSYREYLRIKPRIIHAHLYEGLCIAYVIKLLSLGRAKIVFDCQGSLAAEMQSYTLHKNVVYRMAYGLFTLIERVLLLLPDSIVCSSQNSYDFLREKYHVSAGKISILNDGVDKELFRHFSSGEKLGVRARFGIAPDKMVILYTGSLIEAKGVKELFDAIPSIIAKREDLVFVFGGYGDLEKEYRNKYDKFIQDGQVIFLGQVSYFDLPNVLALADYAIDPKQGSSESSGKLFNYIAAGLPIICFKSDFNFSVLEDSGVYIKNFSELTELKSGFKSTPYYSQHIDWVSIVNNLTLIYGK